MLKKDVTAADYRDTALAMMLICFLLWLALGKVWVMYICLGILLWVMILPKSMKYPSMVWLGFSHLLGKVVSKILLGLAYVVFVIPVSFARRLMGKDPMRVKDWKNGAPSAYVVRDHRYGKDDLQNQF